MSDTLEKIQVYDVVGPYYNVEKPKCTICVCQDLVCAAVTSVFYRQ